MKNLDGQRKTFKAYTHNKIKDVVAHMPPRFGKAFKRAFVACNVVDCYGGEPWRYMSVIAQHLETQNELIAELKAEAERHRAVLKGLLEEDA